MANGSRHALRIVPEVVYGTTPATPAFQPIRHTGCTIAVSKDSLQSEELRDDRQIADFRHGAVRVGGDIPVEVSFGSHDTILEALLGGTWVPTKQTLNQQVSATTTGLARAAGSFLTDGFVVGDVVINSGFTNAGNNGLFRIAAGLTATTMPLTPLAGQTLAVEAAASRTVSSQRAILKAGTTRRSFTAERYFADILTANKPYHRFTGVEFNTMAMEVRANAMATATFGVVGQGGTVNTAIVVGATVAAPTTTSPVDGFSGTLNEGGIPVAVVTAITLNLNNALEPRFVVGSKNTILPSTGRSNCTAQVTAYFEDSSLLEKFLNETESSLDFTMPDTAGNILKVTLPRIKYTGGQPDVSGEGPITLSMPLQALLNSGTGTNIQIERIPA